MFMHALIQKKNNKKAFTLIELIVVIAILAVLIAVLVPTMTGIVTNARQSTADANARTIYSIAKAEYVFQTVNGGTVANATYTQEGTDSFSTAIVAELGDLSGGTFSVTVAGGAVTTASYTSSGSGSLTGVYP